MSASMKDDHAPVVAGETALANPDNELITPLTRPYVAVPVPLKAASSIFFSTARANERPHDVTNVQG